MSGFQGRGKSRAGFKPSQYQSRTEPEEPIRGFSSSRGTNKPTFQPSTTHRPVFISGDQNADTPVTLLANYVRVTQSSPIVIHKYHVTIEPDVGEFLRNRFIQKHSDMFENAYIFDKQNTIMSIVELKDDLVELVETNGPKRNKITIKKVQTIMFGSQEMNQFLNSQLRLNLTHLNWVQILRNFFNINQKIEIREQNINIMPGITASIKQCKLGVLMALDTIHKVVQVQTCLDLIKNNKRNDLQGAIVITLYNNRTYRLCGINSEKNPMETFDDKSGSQINFIQYYQNNYSITIQDARQPLLIAVPSNFEKKQKTKKIFLVPELCYMTGLTSSMQRDFNAKRLLIQKTQLPPKQRVERFNAFLKQLNSTPAVQEELDKWKLKYDETLLHVEGVRLCGEKIILQNDKVDFNQASADFTREIRGKSMFKACNFESWYVVFTERDTNMVNEFLRQAETLSRQFGIRYQRPTTRQLAPNSRGDINAFVTALEQLRDPKMVVVILPFGSRSNLYDEVKRYLCCELGCPSQCITSKTLGKRNMSITGKIVIQMAVKIGAEPWVLDVTSLPQDHTMVIGFDVFRDKARRKKSVGAFVASLNDTFSSWFSKINFHKFNDELSGHFQTNLSMALQEYRKRNNQFPDHIVIFRDGVSEGQYNSVLANEVKQMKQLLSHLNSDDTKISFVCVNKRIITRFFGTDNDTLSNPVSGTTVNTDIVHTNIPQFFLVSQATTQGTVSPSSYDIIANNKDWSIENYQKLAYKLCHLYYNWTGIISVPAPCQYAHKLAYLVGENLTKDYSTSLCNKLFFL